MEGPTGSSWLVRHEDGSLAFARRLLGVLNRLPEDGARGLDGVLAKHGQLGLLADIRAGRTGFSEWRCSLCEPVKSSEGPSLGVTKWYADD